MTTCERPWLCHYNIINPQMPTLLPPTPSDELVQMISNAMSEADRGLLRVLGNQDTLGIDLR